MCYKENLSSFLNTRGLLLTSPLPTLTLGKIEGRRRRRRQRVSWLNGLIDSMDMSLSKLQEIVEYKEA